MKHAGLTVDLPIPFSDKIIRMRQNPGEPEGDFEHRVRKTVDNLDFLRREKENENG